MYPPLSFIYKIVGMTYKEMWQKMLMHADEFDFSNYPVDSKHRSAQNPYLRENTKKINVMKDEMGMAPILEYCGLRAKVYSLHVAPEVEAKMDNFVPVKCKGVIVCKIYYIKKFTIYKIYLNLLYKIYFIKYTVCL